MITLAHTLVCLYKAVCLATGAPPIICKLSLSGAGCASRLFPNAVCQDAPV